MLLRTYRPRNLFGITAIALCLAAAYSPVLASQETKKEAGPSPCSSGAPRLALRLRQRMKFRKRMASGQPTSLTNRNLKITASHQARHPRRRIGIAPYCSCLSRLLSVFPLATNLQSTPSRRLGRLRSSSRRLRPLSAWRIPKAATLENGRTVPRLLGGSMGTPSPHSPLSEQRAS
jgi:hypothetical protein